MFDSVQLLGFGLLCSLTLIHSLYVISIRQTGVLLSSSFRFHLTMDTLDFSYILPTVGRIWDFHPLETCAAGRTYKQAVPKTNCLFLISEYFFQTIYFLDQHRPRFTIVHPPSSFFSSVYFQSLSI